MAHTLQDHFGNAVEITPAEQTAIWVAQEAAQAIEDNTYPEDGSEDHIDRHTYGDQRDCVASLEEELSNKYNTTFNLW